MNKNEPHNIDEYEISEWVEEATDAANKEFREAVHTILSAISSDEGLKANMVLKGGILLAIRYQSHRYTKDIDLSTSKRLSDIDPDTVINNLNDSLALVIEELDYDLDCKVQSYEICPANRPNFTFPSLKINIGYAYKGSKKHRRLQSGQSPTVISIDYSLNEAIPNVDRLRLETNSEILVYTLIDLIAEKYRSLLQQIVRNRNRRQDVFDLFMLVEKFDGLDPIERRAIHDSLIEKSKSRNIEVNDMSLEVSEIRARAEKDYNTLADEVVGDLPEFNTSYERIIEFYKLLPW